MAASGPPSQMSPAEPLVAPAQPGATASAGMPTSAPQAGGGTDSASLWPFVGLAFIALVLAVLWRKNGGLRFLPKRPGGPPSSRPVLHRAHRDLPDRRA